MHRLISCQTTKHCFIVSHESQIRFVVGLSVSCTVSRWLTLFRNRHFLTAKNPLLNCTILYIWKFLCINWQPYKCILNTLIFRLSRFFKMPLCKMYSQLFAKYLFHEVILCFFCTFHSVCTTQNHYVDYHNIVYLWVYRAEYSKPNEKTSRCFRMFYAS